MIITEKTFPLFASAIAAPSDPEEYNEAAMERLMAKLEPYIVRMYGVHSQFKAINRTATIEFASEADRQYYYETEERYLTERAKILADEGISGQARAACLLAILLKYRQSAEWLKAPYFAKLMWQAVNDGFAAICGVCFRQTIVRASQILMDDYNVSRDLITLIWGGAAVSQTNKGKLKKKIIEADGLVEALAKYGVSMDDLRLGDEVEVKEEKTYDARYRFGAQNRQKLAEEKYRFQCGKALYCFFTFKKGGVGLSLPHTDRYTAFKCRTRESGYVFEEDIPKVPTRPRKGFFGLTWSDREIIQALGRGHRIVSLSNTEQTIIALRGTIEQRVKAVNDAKLRCSSKVTKDSEGFDSVVFDNKKYEETLKKLNEIKQSEDDEDGLIGDASDGDEDDE